MDKENPWWLSFLHHNLVRLREDEFLQRLSDELALHRGQSTVSIKGKYVMWFCWCNLLLLKIDLNHLPGTLQIFCFITFLNILCRVRHGGMMDKEEYLFLLSEISFYLS